MNVLADLQKEKNIILSNISKYASEGKTDLVLSESKKLEKVEFLIDRHRQIVLELEDLRINKSISDTTSKSAQKESLGKDNIMIRSSRLISSRELGKKLRERFLSKLEEKGIHLQSMKGKTIYKTKSGKRVGIAVATERQPNRWFLGLPVGGFDHAVLLCQREKGDLVEVLLPEKFFVKYDDSLSKYKDQVKFNIVERGGGVLILVPRIGPINTTSFSGDDSFLL